MRYSIDTLIKSANRKTVEEQPGHMIGQKVFRFQGAYFYISFAL